MEGHQRELEAGARDDERAAGEQIKIAMVHAIGQTRAEIRESQGASEGIHQRDAKQQHGRGASGQHQILDARFQRFLMARPIGHHAVERHRHEFQTQEEAGEVVAAHQEQSAQRGQHQQQIYLFLVAREAAHVGVHQGGGGERHHQNDAHVEQAVAVHDEQRRDLLRDDRRGQEQRGQCRVKADDANGRVPPMVALDGDGQHHRHGGRCRENQRQHGDQEFFREDHYLPPV